MILRIKVFIPIVFAACAAVIINCESRALASNAITEVSVSPDLRRVAIKSNGRFGEHTTAVTARPSRLVIDIPSAVVAPDPRITGLEPDSALRVRISKTASAAQVALDFGAAPVPEHSVQQIDNYLIVLLGDWQPQPRVQKTAVSAKPLAERPVSPRPERAHDPVIHASGPEFLIRSAQEVNGAIVLKVAKRTEPQKVYRIDLGVDFQGLGFNGATVCPVGGPRDASGLLAGKTSSWAQPSAHGKKIGPRKMHVSTPRRITAASPNRKPISKPPVRTLGRPRTTSQLLRNRTESSRIRPHPRLAAGRKLQRSNTFVKTQMF